MITIQEQKFGVEIEVAGVARSRIATAVAEAVQGRITATHCFGYDATVVADSQGREWKVQNDNTIPLLNGHKGSEIITPVLTYSDLELIQSVVRKVRDTGATSPSNSCGVHCHVDSQMHTPESLARLAKMVYKNEDLIFDALQVHPERRRRYTRPMDDEFIDKVAKRRPQTKEKLNEMWFGQYLAHPSHFESHRYYA